MMTPPTFVTFPKDDATAPAAEQPLAATATPPTPSVATSATGAGSAAAAAAAGEVSVMPATMRLVALSPPVSCGGSVTVSPSRYLPEPGGVPRTFSPEGHAVAQTFTPAGCAVPQTFTPEGESFVEVVDCFPKQPTEVPSARTDPCTVDVDSFREQLAEVEARARSFEYRLSQELERRAEQLRGEVSNLVEARLGAMEADARVSAAAAAAAAVRGREEGGDADSSGKLSRLDAVVELTRRLEKETQASRDEVSRLAERSAGAQRALGGALGELRGMCDNRLGELQANLETVAGGVAAFIKSSREEAASGSKQEADHFEMQVLREKLLSLNVRVGEIEANPALEEVRSTVDRHENAITHLERSMEKAATDVRTYLWESDSRRLSGEQLLAATQQQLREELTVLIDELNRSHVVVNAHRFPSLSGNYAGLMTMPSSLQPVPTAPATTGDTRRVLHDGNGERDRFRPARPLLAAQGRGTMPATTERPYTTSVLGPSLGSAGALQQMNCGFLLGGSTLGGDARSNSGVTPSALSGSHVGRGGHVVGHAASHGARQGAGRGAPHGGGGGIGGGAIEFTSPKGSASEQPAEASGGSECALM